MLHDWPELIKLISGHMRTLRGGAPETMKAFSAMAVSASAGGALDAKTKELMALAMSIYMGAGPSVIYASHAIDAYTGFTQTETPSTT